MQITENMLLIIIYLLPLVFIIHDFEEIIAFKPWIMQNENMLQKKFPQISKLIRHISKLSVQAFALAVLEEFIIISIITVSTLIFKFYYAWIAVFTAFSVHIILHLVQWIIIKRYIPTIITSILSIPYIVFGMIVVAKHFTAIEISIACFIGILLMIINLIFIHKCASRFDKFLMKYTTTKA